MIEGPPLPTRDMPANENRKAGKGRSKRRAIIDGATRVFLDNGFEAAGMDTIAREAGVSKQTVYAHFGSKAQLYGAIIHEKCDELLSPIHLPVGEEGDVETVLNDLATKFLEVILRPESLGLFRAMVGECGRFPELSQVFYEVGPRDAMDRLASYFERLDAKGELTFTDPYRSANLFFAMLRSDVWMRSLLSCDPAPTPEECQDWACHVVQVFLIAHG